MEILIRGMKMPKTEPLLVKINPDGSVSTTAKNGFKKYEAVSIHTPHGRLIDADALTISMAVPLNGKPYQYVHIDNIKAAPTIIPADGG